MSKAYRIALEGNIGVGKSTLLNGLPPYLQGGSWTCLPEPVNHPEFKKRLEEFYIDQNKRIELHDWIVKDRLRETLSLKKDQHYISERSFIGDMVFAYANIMSHERPGGQYMDLLYQSIEHGLHFPLDAVVYLEASPSACMKRIKARSRKAEENISLSYIQYLHNCYQTHLPEICNRFKIPMIRIDWNEFRSTDYIAQCIHSTLGITSPDTAQGQPLLRAVS